MDSSWIDCVCRNSFLYYRITPGINVISRLESSTLRFNGLRDYTCPSFFEFFSPIPWKSEYFNYLKVSNTGKATCTASKDSVLFTVIYLDNYYLNIEISTLQENELYRVQVSGDPRIMWGICGLDAEFKYVNELQYLLFSVLNRDVITKKGEGLFSDFYRFELNSLMKMPLFLGKYSSLSRK